MKKNSIKNDAVVSFVRCIWPKTGKFRLDWPLRWKVAGEKTKWEGVVDKEKFKARVDSPIWGALSSLFPDGTNEVTPPFAINSGMGWEDETGKRLHRKIDIDEYETDIYEDDLEIQQAEDAVASSLMRRFGNIIIYF